MPTQTFGPKFVPSTSAIPAFDRAMRNLTALIDDAGSSQMDTEVAAERYVVSFMKSSVDVARVVAKGLSPHLIEHLVVAGFKPAELNWIVTARTLQRRMSASEPLSREESERLARALMVQQLAEEIFGDKNKAHRWLIKPRKVFGGLAASELMQTEQGAHAVEEALNRIDHGFTA